MQTVAQRIFESANTFDSPQLRLIERRHSGRMAERAYLTQGRFVSYCRDRAASNLVPNAWAMKLARGHHAPARRKLLAAMCEANLLQQDERGFRVLALPNNPTLEGPYAADGKRPAPNPTLGGPYAETERLPNPTLEGACADAEQPNAASSTPSTTQKAQQKQPSKLARAGDVSARVPVKTYIDRESTDVGALEAAVEPSLKSGAMKAAAEGSQSKVLSDVRTTRLQLIRGTVDRGIEPPSRIEEELDAPQRVNTQRVKKQQKRVNCRQPSSTAVDLLSESQMPSLLPTEADVRSAATVVWPVQPLSDGVVRWIVEQQFTFNELHAALDHLARAQGRANPPGPNVLKNQLQEIRARKADQAPDRKQPMHVAAKNGANCLDRGALREAINGYLGPDREEHYAFTSGYLDALQGRRVADIVGLYTEMIGEVESAFRWERVADAFAQGRGPKRSGILPPLQDGNAAAKCFALFNVQTLLDKSKMAS